MSVETKSLQIISSGRWFTLDIFNQLGNVGSEVGRTFEAKKRNDNYDAEQSFFRGIELLDATIADSKNKLRARELKLARELYGALFFNTGEYNETPENIENYFMEFAINARAKK